MGKETAGPLSTATVAEPRAGIGRFVGRLTAFGRNVATFPLYGLSFQVINFSNKYVTRFQNIKQRNDSRKKNFLFLIEIESLKLALSWVYRKINIPSPFKHKTRTSNKRGVAVSPSPCL